MGTTPAGSPDPEFELSSWYAEAVSPEGDVFIGYRAHLRRGPLAIRYSAALDTAPRHSLEPTTLDVAEREIHWRAPSLGIDGRWQRSSAGLRATLYESAEGSAVWHCLVPCGGAAVERTGHASLEGLGYLDHLRVTIPPWRLPVRTLRWGRYLSARHSLVWIDGQGGYPARHVYLDGAAIAATHIGDDELTLSDGSRATFDRGMVLRKGNLGATAFNNVPGVIDLLPEGAFEIEECKWRSRAVLELAGAAADEGWCLHELMNWP
jgi:hypothetical protein